MADNQIPFTFNIAARGLEIIKRVKEEVAALLGAVKQVDGQGIVIPVTLDTSKVEQKNKQIAAQTIDSTKKVQDTITKSLQATVKQVDAFAAVRTKLVEALKVRITGLLPASRQKEDWDRRGLEGALADKARELQELQSRGRQLNAIIAHIETSTTRLEHSTDVAGMQGGYSFRVEHGGTRAKQVPGRTGRYYLPVSSELIDRVQAYNRGVEDRHLLPIPTHENLPDFQLKAVAKQVSLGVKITQLLDELAVQYGIALKEIAAPLHTTRKQITAFLGAARGKLLEPQPGEIGSAVIETQFGPFANYERRRAFERSVLKQVMEGELSADQLDKILETPVTQVFKDYKEHLSSAERRKLIRGARDPETGRYIEYGPRMLEEQVTATPAVPAPEPGVAGKRAIDPVTGLPVLPPGRVYQYGGMSTYGGVQVPIWIDVPAPPKALQGPRLPPGMELPKGQPDVEGPGGGVGQRHVLEVPPLMTDNPLAAVYGVMSPDQRLRFIMSAKRAAAFAQVALARALTPVTGTAMIPYNNPLLGILVRSTALGPVRPMEAVSPPLDEMWARAFDEWYKRQPKLLTRGLTSTGAYAPYPPTGGVGFYSPTLGNYGPGGAPPPPPGSVGGNRGFWMPGLGLFGPGVTGFGHGGSNVPPPGAAFYMPNRGMYGPAPGVNWGPTPPPPYPRVPFPTARMPGDWEGGGGHAPVWPGGMSARGLGFNAPYGAGGTIPPPPPPPPGGAGGAGGPGFFGRFGQRFMGLAYYSAAAAIIYPIMSAIYSTLDRARQLEVIVTRIKAIYGDKTLGDQLAIKKTIVDTALRYSTDILETAQTLQLLAQEGLKPGDIQTSLRAVSRGAIGLGIGQEGLANFLISIRNATTYGTGQEPAISPDQATNLLAALFKRGGLSVQNLMSSIQSILPSLESFQSSSRDVLQNTALVGALTSSVVRRTNYTGTQVSNALRYFIARFGNPQTTSELELLTGKEFGTKATGGQQLRSFRAIVTDISEAYNRFLREGQTTRAQAILAEAFGVRQVGVGQNVLGNWKQILDDMTTALNDHSTAADLATESQKTLDAALERLSTRFTDMGGVVTNLLKRVAVAAGWILFPDTMAQTGPGPGGKGASYEWMKYLLPSRYEGYKNLDERVRDLKIFGPPTGLREGPRYVQTPFADLRFPGITHREDYPLFGLPNIPAEPLRNLNFGPRYPGGLPTNQLLLGQAITGGAIRLTPRPGTKGTFDPNLFDDVETAASFDPTDFQAYYRGARKLKRTRTGQNLARRLLGLPIVDPKRDLGQLSRNFESFLSSIHFDDRDVSKYPTLESWMAAINPSLYNKVLPEYQYYKKNIPLARAAEAERVKDIADIQHQARISQENRRYTFAVGRTTAGLTRAFNRRGLAPTITEGLTENLEEIEAGRADSIAQQNENLAVQLALIGKRDDLGEDQLKQEIRNAHQLNELELLTIKHKYDQLALEADINARLQDRLNIVQQIEQIGQGLNNAIRNALLQLPTLTRSRGAAGKVLGPILSSAAGDLYGGVVNRINLFGRTGIFPKISEFFQSVIGPPSEFKNIEAPLPVGPPTPVGKILPIAAELLHPTQIISVKKTPEEIRAEQRAASLRALVIAASATGGAYIGGGGQAAGIGAHLGDFGGMAAGAKLGVAGGGPIGAVIGGIAGGLIGGLFDKKTKKPPELIALEKIAANTGEQTTLLENTNRLLELQNIAFNVPTGFALPRYGPTTSFGGGGNQINVEVNIGSTSASPQQIGAVVAQAISDRLNTEYTSSGRYVARSGY